MKYYLSSYKFGDDPLPTKAMIIKGSHIGILTTRKTIHHERRLRILKEEMDFLDGPGFISEHLDLRGYFDQEQDLRARLFR